VLKPPSSAARHPQIRAGDGALSDFVRAVAGLTARLSSGTLTGMSAIIDQAYLLTGQYKDAENLDARIRLHRLFSTNKYGWQRWCFDHYTLPAEARVLELGGGPAHLWTLNLDRLPPGWRITLTDFSGGMLEQAQRNLAGATQFDFKIVDAQAIPFEAETFDAVIANHMLHHVPDRLRALSEMQRVLRPGGAVYVAANGLSHLRELYELEDRFDPALDYGWSRAARESFTLESGSAEVGRFFQQVRVARYADAFNITAAGPLVDYVLSMATAAPLRARRAELQQFIAGELARQEAIHITKDSGMLIGTKAQ
jgi:SAM-dependent methyltransferase